MNKFNFQIGEIINHPVCGRVLIIARILEETKTDRYNLYICRNNNGALINVREDEFLIGEK